MKDCKYEKLTNEKYEELLEQYDNSTVQICEQKNEFLNSVYSNEDRIKEIYDELDENESKIEKVKYELRKVESSLEHNRDDIRKIESHHESCLEAKNIWNYQFKNGIIDEENYLMANKSILNNMKKDKAAFLKHKTIINNLNALKKDLICQLNKLKEKNSQLENERKFLSKNIKITNKNIKRCDQNTDSINATRMIVDKMYLKVDDSQDIESSIFSPKQRKLKQKRK